MYCTDPGEVDHSTRLISDPVLLVGTTIQYTCNPGFVLEGSSLLTCYSRETGTPIWTSRLPHCVCESCCVDLMPEWLRFLVFVVEGWAARRTHSSLREGLLLLLSHAVAGRLKASDIMSFTVIFMDSPPFALGSLVSIVLLSPFQKTNTKVQRSQVIAP